MKTPKEYSITFTADELFNTYHLMRIGMIAMEANAGHSKEEHKLFESVREKIINQESFREGFNNFMNGLQRDEPADN